MGTPRAGRKRASLKQQQHLSPLSVAGVARRQSLAMPEMPLAFYPMKDKCSVISVKNAQFWVSRRFRFPNGH